MFRSNSIRLISAALAALLIFTQGAALADEREEANLAVIISEEGKAVLEEAADEWDKYLANCCGGYGDDTGYWETYFVVEKNEAVKGIEERIAKAKENYNNDAGIDMYDYGVPVATAVIGAVAVDRIRAGLMRRRLRRGGPVEIRRPFLEEQRVIAALQASKKKPLTLPETEIAKFHAQIDAQIQETVNTLQARRLPMIRETVMSEMEEALRIPRSTTGRPYFSYPGTVENLVDPLIADKALLDGKVHTILFKDGTSLTLKEVTEDLYAHAIDHDISGIRPGRSSRELSGLFDALVHYYDERGLVEMKALSRHQPVYKTALGTHLPMSWGLQELDNLYYSLERGVYHVENQAKLKVQRQAIADLLVKLANKRYQEAVGLVEKVETQVEKPKVRFSRLGRVFSRRGALTIASLLAGALVGAATDDFWRFIVAKLLHNGPSALEVAGEGELPWDKMGNPSPQFAKVWRDKLVKYRSSFSTEQLKEQLEKVGCDLSSEHPCPREIPVPAEPLADYIALKLKVQPRAQAPEGEQPSTVGEP